MKRVTEKDLQAVVDRINRMMHTPLTPYVKRDCANGKGGVHLVAQIGNYHLDHAYGGVQLVQMVNDGGGVRDVLYSGHVPKRELQTAMFAFIRGIECEAERAGNPPSTSK